MNDQIKEMLDRISDLDETGLATLEGEILSAFSDLETQDLTPTSVENMAALADALDSVRGELSRRAEQAEELKAKASEAASRVKTAPQDAAADADTAADPVPDSELASATDSDADANGDAELGAKSTNDDEDVEDDMPPMDDMEVDVDAPDAVDEDEVIDVVLDEDEDDDKKNKDAELAASSEETATTTPEPESEQTLSAKEESPKEETAMTASSDTPDAGTAMVPPAEAAPVARVAEGINLTITAGADIPNMGAGSVLTDMGGVAEAFARRLHTLRNVQGGAGEQHTVATLAFDYPEARQLSGDDASNISKIRQVESLVAAAGICAPLETVYDINVCGVKDRPVRDSLSRFGADRGGVRIYGSPTLSGGTGIWSPPAAANKTCADADCPTPEEIMLEAVYACLCFSNFTNRFFPEVVEANNELSLINHARAAEQNLLAKINAASTKVTFDAKGQSNGGKGVGLTRAVIAAVRRAAAGLRRRHRLAPNAPMRVILPDWVLDAMIADLAMQMPGDGLDTLSLAESEIRRIFSGSNINVTWALDEVDDAGAPLVPAAQAAGALEGFPTDINFPIFPEGSFLFLDGGTLDLGVVRDTTTLKSNEYCTFTETFENVALSGCESLWVTLSNACASGAAAALVDTSC